MLKKILARATHNTVPQAAPTPAKQPTDRFEEGARPAGQAPDPVPSARPQAPAEAPISDRLLTTFEEVKEGGFLMDSSSRFRLVFDMSAFPPAYLDALGVSGKEPLVIGITAHPMRPGGWDYTVALGDRAPLKGAAVWQDPTARFLGLMNRMVEGHVSAHGDVQSPTVSRRLWADLHHAVADRLTHLGDACVMCDKPHEAPGIKPMPCKDPVCVFQHDNLGLANVHLLQQQPALVSLLLRTAGAAVTNTTRRDGIFDDIPADFRSGSASASGAAPVAWERLAATFAALPEVEVMRKAPDLAACLRARSPDAFSLMRWVLNSTRAHVLELPATDCIPELGTERQFLVCATTPEREAEFARAREAAGGSSFAFHGSPLENWHGILRQSLKNYSGKAMMSTGAAHGPGVYLGLDSRTSSSYCGQQSTYASKSPPACLAICEVIRGSAKTHGSIAVVEREEHVILRALLVYAGPSAIPSISAKRIEDACRALFAAQAESFAAFEGVRQSAAAAWSTAEQKTRGAQTRATLPTPPEDLAEESWGYSSDAASSAYDYGSDSDVSAAGSDEASPASSPRPTVRPAVRASVAASPAIAAPPASERPAVARSGRAAVILARELRDLAAHPPTDGFELSPVGDSLLEWQAQVHIDPQTSLGRDLAKLAARTGNKDDGRITLRLDFSPEYPHEPPFVWVESPRFARQCGFISGGAVCSTLLLNGGTASSWSSVYTAEQVVRQVRSLLMEPDANGRLEDVTKRTRYTSSEARTGWTRAKSLHNWSENKRS